MDAFNVKMTPTLMEVVINLRAAPEIRATDRGKQIALPVDNAAFKLPGLFLATPLLANGYVVLYQSGTQPPKGFIEQLTRTAARMGLKLGVPSFEEINFTAYESMLTKFNELAAKKVRFVLAFDTQRSKSHRKFLLSFVRGFECFFLDNLKLLERESQVLTMQIKLETTQRQGLGQTLENLVLKINAKASGVNVVPVIEKCGYVNFYYLAVSYLIFIFLVTCLVFKTRFSLLVLIFPYLHVAMQRNCMICAKKILVTFHLMNLLLLVSPPIVASNLP